MKLQVIILLVIILILLRKIIRDSNNYNEKRADNQMMGLFWPKERAGIKYKLYPNQNYRLEKRCAKDNTLLPFGEGKCPKCGKYFGSTIEMGLGAVDNPDYKSDEDMIVIIEGENNQ